MQVFPALRNLVRMSYASISAVELAERLKTGEPINLIDVREQFEFDIARIEGARLCPLSDFQKSFGEAAIPSSAEIVVMCHHGVRSAHVCRYLMQSGFERVFNLDGGIDAWSAEVDRAVPRY